VWFVGMGLLRIIREAALSIGRRLIFQKLIHLTPALVITRYMSLRVGSHC
jgi:hypothetical protein